jgi:tetratricopeptide (TPR) repeat protein
MKLLKNILLVFTILFFIIGCSGKDKSVSVMPQNIELMQRAAKDLDNIPLRYRAFPIKIDEATAKVIRNCGYCTPEYKADILAMINIKLKDGQREKAVATLLQNVEYNSYFEINGQNYLMLLLSPIEAQYMSLLDKNPVKIILRSFSDDKVFPIEMLSEQLFAMREDGTFASNINREYLLKINADTARHIESGDVVNIKIKGDDKPIAKGVKILKFFLLNGDSFASFNVDPMEAQYLFFAEADKKKIYLSKSLNKEFFKKSEILPEEEIAKITVSKRAKVPDKKKDTVTEDARQASLERYKIGIRYYNQGDYNKTKQEWEAALELDPDNTDASLGLKRIGAINPIQ